MVKLLRVFSDFLGINEFNIPHVNTILEELDIYKIVEIVESLFEEINKGQHTIEYIPAN